MVLLSKTFFTIYPHLSTGSESLEEAKKGKGLVNKPAFGGPFRLISADHGVVTESELRGSWSLLYFGYTSSPDVDPEELQKMAEAINMLGLDLYVLS